MMVPMRSEWVEEFSTVGLEACTDNIAKLCITMVVYWYCGKCAHDAVSKYR